MLDIRIAKPCSQTWTAMKGDDQVRHCGACRKNVYNISEMTEAEVEALIRRTEGRFCARIYRRTDGRVLTADCPRGVAAVRRRRTLAVTGAFAVFAGALYAMPTMGNRKVRVQVGGLRAEPPLKGKIDLSNDDIGDVVVKTPPVKQGFDVRLGEITVESPAQEGKYEVQMGAPMVQRTK